MLLLQIHDVKIISHDFTMVDCSIVVPPGFAPNEFMGFSLNPCTRDEARIKHVRVKSHGCSVWMLVSNIMIRSLSFAEISLRVYSQLMLRNVV